MRVADQFLFGYDDGHRLLGGSRELDAQTMVELLGATDAAMAEDSVPLVTGLALARSHEFAFAVTWGAREASRPGAVWAHALIVEAAALHERRSVEVLLGLPRRPAEDGSDLDRYREALPLDGVAPAPASYLPPQPLELELLAEVTLAAYQPDGEGIVVADDLGAGARALLALWSAQWPDLRAGFSFRTRELVRPGASEFDVTLARKVRGVGAEAPAPARAAAQPWLAAVANDATTFAPSRLREFLWAFGPMEPRDPRRLRALATLWLSVSERDGAAVRAALERDWPARERGAALKQALFGEGNDDWWSLDERSRVNNLLGASPSIWDVEGLRLEQRTRALAKVGALRGARRG